MKGKSRFLMTVVAAVASVCCLAGCGNATSSAAGNSSSASATSDNGGKIGLIMVGDNTEGYTEAHINGVNTAAAKLGISSDRLIYKEKVGEDANCTAAIDDLESAGCKLIVSNSYGHQDYMCDGAKTYTDSTFISMTGDYSAISGLNNFKNAFVSIYEARYVSGVVAGLKLKELVTNNALDTTFNQDGKGNWKIGYVGAYSYAEVISGFTSFYLGVKSVVENVVMDVKFTNSWFDISGEGAAADALVKEGCVIIGQHADSTGAPAKVESLLGTVREGTKKYVCYSVGFNIDMIPSAPNAALTSALNIWSVYYEYAFKQYITGQTIDNDWCKGFNAGAVSLSDLNTKSVAAGTADTVTETISKIKDGSLEVFDTSKFTVDGKKVTSATVDLSKYDFTTATPTKVYNGASVEAIKTDAKGVSYYSESTYRSAPYFDLKIDGINWLN
jgi:basic membrane protein A